MGRFFVENLWIVWGTPTEPRFPSYPLWKPARPVPPSRHRRAERIEAASPACCALHARHTPRRTGPPRQGPGFSGSPPAPDASWAASWPHRARAARSARSALRSLSATAPCKRVVRRVLAFSLTYPRPKPISPCRLSARVCARRSSGSAQAHHIDRGKFQPLGFVDGHYAHHVLPGIHHGGTLLASPAAVCPDGFHKAVQAVRMAPLIVVGARWQSMRRLACRSFPPGCAP